MNRRGIFKSLAGLVGLSIVGTVEAKPEMRTVKVIGFQYRTTYPWTGTAFWNLDEAAMKDRPMSHIRTGDIFILSDEPDKCWLALRDAGAHSIDYAENERLRRLKQC